MLLFLWFYEHVWEYRKLSKPNICLGYCQHQIAITVRDALMMSYKIKIVPRNFSTNT